MVKEVFPVQQALLLLEFITDVSGYLWDGTVPLTGSMSIHEWVWLEVQRVHDSINQLSVSGGALLGLGLMSNVSGYLWDRTIYMRRHIHRTGLRTCSQVPETPFLPKNNVCSCACGTYSAG